ncbi:DUF484 family protein [Neptunomonas japonica]|uniref:DUF484 domain-containing protein n=1 Tax=Neptunomonas japonica JAMM 1380 TaxID=1441457 RepID=A0A7R6PH74_9GAMM|nr:DUF484 family protein [Neptunomonas japonica]BBB28226.1 conserved hypothetical protein [Neptunomonas japonica JAMM 1380]
MSQSENQQVQATEFNENDVADYLAKNPDFFMRHKPLLEVMSVPHETGRAISLIERQTSLLRDRNQKLTIHLSDLIDIARHNDSQFEKTKRMVLALLDSATLDDVAVALEESLCRDFYGDETSLVLFSDNPLNVNNLKILPRDTAGVIEPLMKTNMPTCGQLSLIENRFLFEDDAVKVQSAAVIPLVKGETIGLLAIGSYDPYYFQSSQGTLFLSYVGEVLSRVASRIVHEEQV